MQFSRDGIKMNFKNTNVLGNLKIDLQINARNWSCKVLYLLHLSNLS